MITHEQVADLRKGDVVRVTGWQGLTVEGPLSTSLETDTLWLGEYLRLTFPPVSRPPWMDQPEATLTVVARAPRKLYVNHDRTGVWPGDVVRGADGGGVSVWMADRNGGWWLASMGTVRLKERRELPARLRLLVDGETGQVVP